MSIPGGLCRGQGRGRGTWIYSERDAHLHGNAQQCKIHTVVLMPTTTGLGAPRLEIFPSPTLIDEHGQMLEGGDWFAQPPKQQC
jgi:hypothetical protein